MEKIECGVKRGEKSMKGWFGEEMVVTRQESQMRRHHACCIEISIIYYMVFSEASAIYFHCCMSYFTL